MPVLVEAALLIVTGGALGAAATTVLAYAIVIGAYYAYGTYQARQAREKARASFNDSLKDRLVMTATTDAPRSRVYGRVRNVDGILFKNTHGTNSEFYTFVVAVAGHEVDAIESVWFGDQELTLDGSGYVQTAPFALTKRTSVLDVGTTSGGAGSKVLASTPVAGSVTVVQTRDADNAPISLSASVAGTTVTYSGGDPAFDGSGVGIQYQVDTITSKARVRKYLGAPGQDLSGDLIALGVPDVTSAHKFAGIACLLVTLQFDSDAFSSGVPAMSATMRGAKVYDPRTATTAWTRNPALIARDWALYQYGGGASVAELDDASFITAANGCDVAHTFSDGTGSLVSVMYTADLVAPGLVDPTQTLNEIVAAMAGKYAWCGGLLRIKAGHYQAPVATIDATWLSGTEGIDITPGIGRSDLVNIYRPSIADAAHGYVVAPTEPVRATGYITADGIELPRDLTLLAVTDTYHAQHVAGVMLRDSRAALSVKLPCNLRAYPLEVFDTVAVTLPHFGWAAKEFEILSWAFSPTGGVLLTMKETAASIFDPDALFPVSDATPNTALPLPWYVPAPTGLACVSGTVPFPDGSIVARVLVTWDVYPLESVRQSGRIEVQFTPAFDALPAGDWPSVTANGGAESVVITGLRPDTTYLFRARAINSVGVRSPWSVQVVHIVADIPSTIADWTDLPGRPLIFRVVARGYTDTAAPVGAQLYDENGTAVGPATNRSYMFARIRRSDGVVIGISQYDVYASSANAAALAGDLNSTGPDSLAVVWTSDEPAANRLTGGLDAAMYRCGASRAVFGKPTFAARSAYVLVGIGGCGEGNGFESYCDGAVDPTHQFADVAFMLKGGNLIVTGASATPGQLTDYGYTGTLDATTDLSLVARGNCVVSGNYASKLGGAYAWDSDVYSRDAAYGACMCSAVVVDPGLEAMFGLNSDPTTDASYTSIDFAWYINGAGSAIYESGSAALGSLTFAAGDVLLVVYDGSSVRYLQNNVLRRTVTAAPGLSMFFDSSFAAPGAALRNIRFGALSPNDWASIGGVNVTTGQIAAGAATHIDTDDYDFAGAVFVGPSGLQTVRSFTITPTVDCQVEVTATLEAKPFDNDGGASCRWLVTPGGGSPLLIGSSRGSGGASTAVAAYSFAALAGVALVFDIDVARGGYPNITLFRSVVRVTQIKR